jgi:hypothetical protein
VIVKRTVTDAQGNFQYSVLHEHCSHSSAAGSLQVMKSNSLISSKLSNLNVTVVFVDSETYTFTEL